MEELTRTDYSRFRKLLKTQLIIKTGGAGATFEGINKNNCFRSFFVCQLRKSWKADSGALRALELHCHFITTKIWSWRNFVHYRKVLNDFSGWSKLLMLLMLPKSFKQLNMY